MKVNIQTLGCKVNIYESEYIISLLQKHGYEIVGFDDDFDVHILNTCTVTNTSDIKTKKILRSARRKRPDALIVAIGCFVQKNEDIPKEVDIAIGTKDKASIIDLLNEHKISKEKIVQVEEPEYFEDMYIDKFENHTRAFVKIQDGCENFCSYCIIPFVRGKCRSKDKTKVIDEVKALVNNSYKEVVLTGIHTGNYGSDVGSSLASLIKELVLIKGLERLRISSIEITELDDEILKLLAKEKIIVDHLHIPIQAASDELLKIMNRKYDIEYFKNKLKEIRAIRKDISITTDIIVAHPGETDEIFEKSLETIKELAFSKIHVFPYSKRDGTAAAKMHQIDDDVKKARVKKLLALSKELEENYKKKFIGKTKAVLIEKNIDGISSGYTDNYIYLKTKKNLKAGTIVNLTVQ